MKKKTIAFDFDGVITKYEGLFRGHDKVDEPRLEIIEVIKRLKEEGYKILIYSTRSNKVLKEYCKKYEIPVDYFNKNPEYKTGNSGKPVASVYIDDRAICYKGQKTEKLLKEIKNFKAHYNI